MSAVTDTVTDPAIMCSIPWCYLTAAHTLYPLLLLLPTPAIHYSCALALLLLPQVRLAPVSLSLTPPDALTFHADLTALIEAGVAASPARHVRNGERTEMVWEARRGACRLTNYYVQVRHSTQHTAQHTVFSAWHRMLAHPPQPTSPAGTTMLKLLGHNVP